MAAQEITELTVVGNQSISFVDIKTQYQYAIVEFREISIRSLYFKGENFKPLTPIIRYKQTRLRIHLPKPCSYHLPGDETFFMVMVYVFVLSPISAVTVISCESEALKSIVSPTRIDVVAPIETVRSNSSTAV